MKKKLSSQVLSKLAWPNLVQQLASHCHSVDGAARSLALTPNLDQKEATSSWEKVSALKELVAQGYRPPVGALESLEPIFKGASLGRLLEGLELRSILGLLDSVDRVFAFASDFSGKCFALDYSRGCLRPLPKLAAAISRAVDHDGKLVDEASGELSQIRRSRRSLRSRIEEELHRVVKGNSEYEAYLQDDFFTVRSDRYVVPIRVDGRGRVKGAIVDTSSSGQTLFLEPFQIAKMNEQLKELEIAEKLEVIRIFRELSRLVTQDVGTLSTNYEELISLDVLSAMAQMAFGQQAVQVNIASSPTIYLLGARHPLIRRPDGSPAVENNIELDTGRSILVISGPNAGGKTVVLETVGLLHLMAKAGLLIPADKQSTIYFFDDILLEMGDSQNLSENLSTFSGHILGLTSILNRATNHDLVLLDELASGTEPETGSAIAQAILENLADQGITALATTHYDALKGLAVTDPRFRNGSMEFSVKNIKPTYKLILDVPGQSYGLEVAAEMGLNPTIIDRAKSLRGQSASSLDLAIHDLMIAREKANEVRKALEEKLLDVQTEKDRWQRDIDALNLTRTKAATTIATRFDDELAEMRQTFDDLIRETRRAVKDAAKVPVGEDVKAKLLANRHAAEKTIANFDQTVARLKSEFAVSKSLPGSPADYSALSEGDRVYVNSISKEGTVAKLGSQKGDPIEIAIGLIKMRTTIDDLRLVEKKRLSSPGDKSTNPRKTGPARDVSAPAIASLVIQTPRNTCDLRGLDLDDGLKKMWSAIDSGVLRGESEVILIHGHGTDTLKSGVRAALLENPPYDLSFRAGNHQEGGDGITIVFLRK